MIQNHGIPTPQTWASKTIARTLAVTILATTAATSFAAESTKQAGAITNTLVAVLAATNNVVQLGEPINISLKVTNQGDQETMVEKSETAFDCFEVNTPDGPSAPYVGFIGQIMSSQVSVQPSSTTIIEEGLDLTDKYVFEKAGRYSIRFKGEGNGIPASNAITVDVAPGQLTELDKLVVRLLPVRPTGWDLSKSPRRQHEVTPSGRSATPGYEAHICRNYMQGEAVYLWFTKAEAQPDPNQKSSLRSKYLGRTRGLYVYVEEGSKAPALWSKAIEDISSALQLSKD